MRRIEEVDSSQELNRLLREIEETRTKLHKAQKEFGDSTSAASLTYIEKEADAAIHSGNVPLVAKALESMNFLYFDLTKIQQAMIFIMSCSARYNLISWKDASRARYLIDSGLSMMKIFFVMHACFCSSGIVSSYAGRRGQKNFGRSPILIDFYGFVSTETTFCKLDGSRFSAPLRARSRVVSRSRYIGE